MTQPVMQFPTTWTRGERSRLAGVVVAVVTLHIAGWSLYLWQARGLSASAGFAGAGTLAYVLGMRHAFDADHIAAIDDTTRLMLLRGKRPVGVGFFFAMGHSAVVLMLALLTAVAASSVTGSGLTRLRHLGALVSITVAIGFLLLVAGLNLLVFTGLLRLWRQYRAGALDRRDIDLALLNRGLMNRLLGGRARNLVTSSWHMAPVGFLFGLGLETASEVTLLALSATTAAAGGLPLLAVVTLPLLFAAGMSMMDTADSLIMSQAYSWAYRSPGRRLYYNLATTAITVVVGFFVASVYLAAVLHDHAAVSWLRGYAGLAGHFQLLGYVMVGLFVVAWSTAVLLWKYRYGREEPT